MKKYNRRDFLKLTGASALALALAACGGSPSAPAAPAKDAQAIFSAINAYLESNGQQKLTYDSDLETYVTYDFNGFDACDSAEITRSAYNEWITESLESPLYNSIRTQLSNKGIPLDSRKYYGIDGMDSTSGNLKLTRPFPETEAELNAQIVELSTKLGNSNSIGIVVDAIKGKTYWAAIFARNNTIT